MHGRPNTEQLQIGSCSYPVPVMHGMQSQSSMDASRVSSSMTFDVKRSNGQEIVFRNGSPQMERTKLVKPSRMY